MQPGCECQGKPYEYYGATVWYPSRNAGKPLNSPNFLGRGDWSGVMRVDLPDVLSSISDHPLIAAWFRVLLVLVLLLGGMHVCRILGRCLIVLVQEVKHELAGCWAVVKDFVHELTTWKSDP